MSTETVRIEAPPSLRMYFDFQKCLFETPEVETVTYLRFFSILGKQLFVSHNREIQPSMAIAIHIAEVVSLMHTYMYVQIGLRNSQLSKYIHTLRMQKNALWSQIQHQYVFYCEIISFQHTEFLRSNSGRAWEWFSRV